jgi:hypothetical protein
MVCQFFRLSALRIAGKYGLVNNADHDGGDDEKGKVSFFVIFRFEREIILTNKRFSLVQLYCFRRECNRWNKLGFHIRVRAHKEIMIKHKRIKHLKSRKCKQCEEQMREGVNA